RAEAEEGPDRARRVADTVFTALLLANLAICTLGIWQAEAVVVLFASSWQDDPAKFELAVSLTRWLFPILAFVSLVSYVEGLLNHRRHFFVPKFAPALISAGMIAGVAFAGTRDPVWALAAGTLGGAAAHLLVC